MKSFVHTIPKQRIEENSEINHYVLENRTTLNK